MNQKEFRKFLGQKVNFILLWNLVLGVVWFVAEMGFLFVFQGFLFSIGMLQLDQVNLPGWYPTGLNSNLIILAVYGLFRAILTSLNRMLPQLASQVFIAEQRSNLLKVSFFSSHKKTTAELVSLFGDLTSKAGLFINFCSSSIGTAISLLLLMCFAIRLAPIEALISFMLLGLLYLPIRAFNRRIKKYGQGLVSEWSQANKVLIEGLKNLFLLRVYNLLGVEYRKGVKRIEAYEEQYTKYTLVSSIGTGVPIFFGLIVLSVVTIISKNFLSTNPLNFVGFLYIFQRFAQSASQLSTTWNNAVFYMDSFLNLKENLIALETLPSVPESTVRENKIEKPSAIQIQNLSFSYKSGQPIFKDFSLKMAPSDFLVVKGTSGTGKSTLVRLLMGLESPHSGTIVLDGLSPSDFVSKHASDIGYVGPEPYLVPGTVRENLLYGNFSTEIKDEVLWDVLAKLGLKDEVMSFKSGLDEALYEDTQISTGQKQRLSFARAILRDPSLLLLDEATANIDKKTESLILKYLFEVRGKTTVIAISHKDSFDHLATQKLELGN